MDNIIKLILGERRRITTRITADTSDVFTIENATYTLSTANRVEDSGTPDVVEHDLIVTIQPEPDVYKRQVQQTIVNTGKVYVFFDDCGALSLREAGHMKSDVVIGERSLVTDYSYKTSIDSDVYNSVKLARPNEETGKTDIYIVEDSYNIGRWGLLRYYEQVDESMNPAQIRQQAETMLTYYDELKRTLSIDCLGVPGLRAGQMVFLNLPNLGDIRCV